MIRASCCPPRFARTSVTVRRLAAIVLGSLLGACGLYSSEPVLTVEHVDESAAAPPRRPETVKLYTHDTKPPEQAGHIVAHFNVRVHHAFGFGYDHLRVLRERGAALGCDAVLVGPPEPEAYPTYCSNNPPDPCVDRYDARCVRHRQSSR